MTSPSPRPTREEVDSALVAPHTEAARILAAEVRALRAELAEIHDAIRPRTDPSLPQRRDDPEEIRARIAALTPRAPQPAEPTVRDDLARNVAQLWRRDRAAADGQPMLVGRTYQGELWTALNQLAAAYVDAGAPQPAVPDGRRYDQLTEQEGGPPNERLPLYAPAVPDGEDAPAPLSDLDARQVAAVPALLAMCDEAEQRADREQHWRGIWHGMPCAVLTTREVRAAVAHAVPGEDVPALLRSLADRWDRQQATYPDTAHGRAAAAAVRLCAREVRAAVAAALARPTGHQP